jgi:hypothetical protein
MDNNENSIDFSFLGKLTIISLDETFSEMEESLDVYANKEIAL